MVNEQLKSPAHWPGFTTVGQVAPRASTEKFAQLNIALRSQLTPILPSLRYHTLAGHPLAGVLRLFLSP